MGLRDDLNGISPYREAILKHHNNFKNKLKKDLVLCTLGYQLVFILLSLVCSCFLHERMSLSFWQIFLLCLLVLTVLILPNSIRGYKKCAADNLSHYYVLSGNVTHKDGDCVYINYGVSTKRGLRTYICNVYGDLKSSIKLGNSYTFLVKEGIILDIFK